MSVHWLLCFTNETWGGFCKGDRKFLPLPVQCFSYLKKYLKPGHSIYCYLADAKGFIGNLTVTSDVFVDKKPVEGYPDEYTSRINVEANLILDSANVILVEPLMESLILFKKGVLAGKEDPVGSFWKNFQTAANGSPSVIPSDDAEIILEKMLESKAAASINAGPASCAEETHADALPTTEHKPDRATSHYLTVGEVYSRAKLAEIFAIPNEGPIKTGVFRPDKTRFDSIWLFVTEEKTADMAQFKDLLSGGELYWQGQLEQGTDNLIIGHMNLGLEILVFYRKSKYQFPNSAFVFEGTFAYHSHELGSKPTNFILKRLPSALSMQAPHRDTTRFQILEELIANAHEIGTLFFLFFTVLHCKQVSGEGLHFVPTSLLFANIYKTILATGDFSQLRLPKSDTSITQRIAQILSSSSVGQSFGMAELEHELRREISETELSMALNTIAQFLNLQVQTGTREEIISLSKERFALGTCPLVISQTGSLLQLHPEWITYFENSADELLSLISEKLLSLISQASEDVDLVDNLLEQLSQARDAALKQGGYELSPAQENKNETSDHETLTLDVVYSTGDWQESSRNDMSSASLLSNDEITQACFNEQVSEIVSDTPLPVEAEKLWDHPDRMHQSTAQSDCEVHERTSFSAPTVSEDLGRFSAHPTFIHHTEEPIKEASYGAEQLEGVGKVLVQEAPIPEQALVEGSLVSVRCRKRSA